MYHNGKGKESLQTAVIQNKKSLYLGNSLQCFIKASDFLHCNAGKCHDRPYDSICQRYREDKEKKKRSVNINVDILLNSLLEESKKLNFQWKGT